MADDILDDMEKDFDEEMSDLLEDDELDDDSDDEFVEETSDEKVSIIHRILDPVKELLKKILGSTKAIIILAVSIVLVILTIFLLWFFVFTDNEDAVLAPKQDETQTAAQSIEEKEIVFEDIVELEPFERIPLKTSSTMGRVSLQLSLELVDPRYRKQIYSLEDRIRSIVTQQVGNTTWLELRNPEGKILLKYNLLQRINAIFPNATVRNVYFTFFIMQ